MAHLQIKNLPEDLHEELRRRASTRHQSVREYVLELIRRDLARPTLEEWFERVERRAPVAVGRSMAELVREARAEREQQLADARATDDR